MASKESKDEKSVLERGTATLTLLGLALYGVLRFGQEKFGSEFGVSPEEIGLSYTGTIGRAAVTLVLVITACSLVVFVGVVFSIVATIAVLLLENRRIIWKLAAWLVIVAAGISALVFVADRFEEVTGPAVTRWIDNAILALPFLGFVLLVFGALWSILEKRNPTLLTQIQGGVVSLLNRRGALLGASVVIMLPALIFWFFLVAQNSAEQAARLVKRGESAVSGDSLNLLGLEARPVRVIGDTPQGVDVSSVMYLGRANGVIVLYDLKEGRVLRIPADGITLLPPIGAR